MGWGIGVASGGGVCEGMGAGGVDSSEPVFCTRSASAKTNARPKASRFTISRWVKKGMRPRYNNVWIRWALLWKSLGNLLFGHEKVFRTRRETLAWPKRKVGSNRLAQRGYWGGRKTP